MRLTLLIAAISLGMLACDRSPEAAAPPRQAVAAPQPTVAPPPEPLPAPTRVGEALTRLDAEIALHRKQGEAGQGWLHFEQLAQALLARARLTGRVDEYVAAGAALDRAFAAAPAGSGPFFSLAQYKYTVHRLDEVEPALALAERQILRKVSDEAASAGLRGDLALHRADLKTARESYTRALELERSVSAVARLAFLDLKTGQVDAARRGYEEAASLAKSDDSQRAWALLHRGIVELEQNDPAAALGWYEKANEAFSGWYLVEEHIAEAKLLLGEVDTAIAMYDSIIARTPNGEFMAALADCYSAKGDAAAQAQWQSRAKAAFEADIVKLPSAATGHALEFYLGYDRERALELARKNLELRPNHEARMFLAQALLQQGDRDGARAALEPVAQSEWAAADFLATVAIVFADEPVGAAAAARVAAIDPNAVSELREATSPGG